MSKKNLLSEDQIREYAKKYKSDFKDGPIEVEEIGDGNINYVYKARSKNNETIIFKKADKLLRSSGRPLDQGRIDIEQAYLVLANDYSQGRVPKIYEFDKEESLIVMEDISAYKNLRTEMIRGILHEDLSQWIIDFLAPILANTCDVVMDAEEKKMKMKSFVNPEMCKISEDLVLTEPYNDYKKRNILLDGQEDYVREHLYEDRALRREVNQLKNNFMNNSQALLHGDLHSGSIFVNENGLRIIDSEFAFYGPAGYDIGNVLAHFIIAYMTAKIDESKDEKFLDLLLEEIYIFYKGIFPSLLDSLLAGADSDFYQIEYLRDYVDSIRMDSLGYLGTEIIRRVVGDTKVKEIEEVSEKNRNKSDRALIKFGKYCIMNRRTVLEAEDLINYIKELTR